MHKTKTNLLLLLRILISGKYTGSIIIFMILSDPEGQKIFL
jgi:hypothetical protein